MHRIALCSGEESASKCIIIVAQSNVGHYSSDKTISPLKFDESGDALAYLEKLSSHISEVIVYNHYPIIDTLDVSIREHRPVGVGITGLSATTPPITFPRKHKLRAPQLRNTKLRKQQNSHIKHRNVFSKCYR